MQNKQHRGGVHASEEAAADVAWKLDLELRHLPFLEPPVLVPLGKGHLDDVDSHLPATRAGEHEHSDGLESGLHMSQSADEEQERLAMAAANWRVVPIMCALSVMLQTQLY